MTRRPLAFLPVVGAAALVLVLAACAAEPGVHLTVVPTQPSGTMSAQPSASVTPKPVPTSTSDSGRSGADEVVIGCSGGIAAVNADGGSFLVSEDCARVVLGGNGVTLRVTATSVDELLVQGQSNVVVAGDVTGLTLEGQGNTVQSSAAGAVTVRGDGNTVVVAGAIGSLEITGANNAVSAPGVASKIVRGDGNTAP